MPTPDGERCARCGKPHKPSSPVTWSPLFSQYLCPNCLIVRTDEDLRRTARANHKA